MIKGDLTVCDLALIICGVAKSIIQMREQTCRPGCHNIFNRKLARRGATFSEIANHLALAVFVLCVERGRKGDECDQNQYQTLTTISDADVVFNGIQFAISPPIIVWTTFPSGVSTTKSARLPVASSPR